MSSSDTQARVGKALVDFAVKSEYPDEEAVIAANVESSALSVALELLNNARASLEVSCSLSFQRKLELCLCYASAKIYLLPG